MLTDMLLHELFDENAIGISCLGLVLTAVLFFELARVYPRRSLISTAARAFFRAPESPNIGYLPRVTLMSFPFALVITIQAFVPEYETRSPKEGNRVSKYSCCPSFGGLSRSTAAFVSLSRDISR